MALGKFSAARFVSCVRVLFELISALLSVLPGQVSYVLDKVFVNIFFIVLWVVLRKVPMHLESLVTSISFSLAWMT